MSNHITAGQNAAYDIIDTIRQVMTDKGVTLNTLAEDVGLPVYALRCWIQSDVDVTFDLRVACAICSALGIAITATQNPHD